MGSLAAAAAAATRKPTTTTTTKTAKRKTARPALFLETDFASVSIPLEFSADGLASFSADELQKQRQKQPRPQQSEEEEEEGGGEVPFRVSSVAAAAAAARRALRPVAGVARFLGDKVRRFWGRWGGGGGCQG